MILRSNRALTFQRLIDTGLDRGPERVAGHFGDTPRTWSEVEGEASSIARSLWELGLRPGEAVAIYGANSAEWLDVWLGAPRIGALTVPVNVAYQGDFLTHQLRDTESRMVLTDSALLPNVLEVAPHLPLLHTVIVKGDFEADSLPGVTLVPLRALARWGSREMVGVQPIAWDEPSSIFYTSGTTGPSKGVLVSQNYLLAGARAVAESCGFCEDDVLYGSLPMFHFGGSVGHVLAGLIAGAPVVVDSRFHVSTCWQRIRRYDATGFIAASAMLRMLLRRQPGPEDASLGLRLILTGAVPADLHGSIEHRYACKVRSIYGMTEAFPLCIQNADEPAVPASLGSVNGHFEVRITDFGGDEVPAGETGELVCRPSRPAVMFSGYHNRAADTLRQLRDLWFHTGDLARRDGDGNLFFVDRHKDIIRCRGENVAAFEIEQVVLAHGDVQQCAAFGVPSEISGEDVKICVVPFAGARVMAEALIEHCAARLPRFAVPRYVELADSLPKTVTGRVRKDELKTRQLDADTFDREASQ